MKFPLFTHWKESNYEYCFIWFSNRRRLKLFPKLDIVEQYSFLSLDEYLDHHAKKDQLSIKIIE